ncbi:MAG UNVERIFIED_CONTAM: hypothetical protein LVR18_52175 [Planctomycetaceae bacterium]
MSWVVIEELSNAPISVSVEPSPKEPSKITAREKVDFPKSSQASSQAAAVRGQKHQLTVMLDPQKATRAPLPEAAPDWVQIGPFEAESISRSGNEVQVTVSIPADAPAGILLDCHVEFSTAGRRQVFKLNEAFRVTVEGDE